MEYVRLGWSGVKVSKICLGTMSFGDPALQSYGTGGWVVGKDEAFKVLSRAWDLGINFYDTANVSTRSTAGTTIPPSRRPSQPSPTWSIRER